ncbi:MAG TPA: FKBP-type peptidyl-prolyl cis-trans isomerase [Myxococcota bacterium]|jgi:peptidylprolyl isomerase
MRIPLVLSLGLSLLPALSCTPPDAKEHTDKDGKSAPGDAKKDSPVTQAADIPAPPDVAAPPADAEKTASGLASKVQTPGTGKEHPGPTDTVEVHYTGWTSADGHMFDSSVKRGRTAKFPLNRVIKGWTEGLQLMVEGEKRRFWIPPDLAYGDHPAKPGAPSGQLTFDVELIKIMQAPKPLPVPPTPTDVAAPPKDAQKTASGIAYKVLSKGTGTVHPVPADTVEVHYAGWTTDGKMFDNDYARGTTTKFPLGGVIKGWTEGVQLMTVGEKTRFWIPAELAYGNNPRPGAPQGMLVFDIELVSIPSKPTH